MFESRSDQRLPQSCLSSRCNAFFNLSAFSNSVEQYVSATYSSENLFLSLLYCSRLCLFLFLSSRFLQHHFLLEYQHQSDWETTWNKNSWMKKLPLKNTKFPWWLCKILYTLGLFRSTSERFFSEPQGNNTVSVGAVKQAANLGPSSFSVKWASRSTVVVKLYFCTWNSKRFSAV